MMEPTLGRGVAKKQMDPDTNYGLEEAGMAQLDDSVGALMKALDDMGEANNTIVVFGTRLRTSPFNRRRSAFSSKSGIADSGDPASLDHSFKSNGPEAR